MSQLHDDSVFALLPSDPGFRSAARRVWEERQDLQQHYPDPDSSEFAIWVAANALLEYPDRFAGYFAPLPPPEVRFTGSSGTSDHDYLWNSVHDFRSLWDLISTYRSEPAAEPESVLDFGCGAGRVARQFDRACPNARITGVDVCRTSVEWCAANLSGDFVRIDTSPPLPFPDDSFDVIYSVSVFSHLDERANVAWTAELARVCKPDGIILLTAQGTFALWVISRSAAHQEFFRLDTAQARRFARDLETAGFLHYDMGDAWREPLDADSSYGMSYFTPAWARETWRPFLRVLGDVPAALALFQDIYVARPRAGE